MGESVAVDFLLIILVFLGPDEIVLTCIVASLLL